jgi:magnesium transporter
MNIRIYELKKDTVLEVDIISLAEIDTKGDSLYMVDIKTEDRTEAAAELEKQGLPEELRQNMLTPADHIRFEYIGEIIYGELAFFSSKEVKTDFAGVIIRKNILYLIHSLDEGVLDKMFNSFHSFTQKQKEKITDIASLFFYLIHEGLSYHGRIILSYRENIEDLAKIMEKDQTQISPDDFLKYKSQLSSLTQVIERQIYTLSLPPAENVLDFDNPYRIYFNELLKGISLFKVSLEHTSDRLDSLHDHFQLLMQDKMNKRLNLLAIIQSIFLPLTLIAGIYGMNFKYMPELDYPHAYYMTLGGMVLLAAGFIWFFYRHKWFE